MGSIDLINRPKNHCQHSVGIWRRSKRDLVDRSTVAWYNSRNRCQQSTMEIWHKSTNTWFNSKDRCQQSAKGMLDRSVSKWNQSADHVHQVIRIQHSEGQSAPRLGQIQDNGSPPSSPGSAQSPRSSVSRFYSRSTNPSPTNSSPSTTAQPSLTRTMAVKPKFLAKPSLPPMEQIRAFHEASVVVSSLVKETKQLRDDKKQALGEIELDWIDSTIADADKSASDLSAFVAPFWANQYKNKQIGSSNCKKWTRRDYQRAIKKESNMILSHSRVETVFVHLESLPVELNATRAGSKDEEFVASLGISELASVTRVVSVVELSGQSPVTRHQAELPMPIPKIVVTQHDNDDDDMSSCS